MFRTLICVSIAFFLIQGTPSLGHHHHHHHKCECPNTDLNLDFKNSTQYEAGLKKTLNGLWNTSRPVLGKDGQMMKRAILGMANSDSSKWMLMALSTSVWTWSNLPFYEKEPSLCVFSQIINSTLAWQKTKDGSQLHKAVDNAAKFVQYSSMRILHTSVTNAGCTPPAQEIPKISCYKNGAVYPIKEMWDLRGEEFPYGVQCSALQMYKSPKWEERAMAAMATASLSDAFTSIPRLFDNSAMFGIFNAQLVPKIPKCCCPAFIKKVKGLVEANRADALRVVEIIKKNYPVKDC